MTKQLRVFAIVVFLLAGFTGTVSAYDKKSNENNDNDNRLSVIINLDGVPRMVTTEEETVGELLNNLKDISLDNYSFDTKETTKLSNNMVINLASVKEKIVKKTVSLQFGIEKKENNSLEKGKENVLQEGIDGEAEVTIKESYSGEELINSEEVSRRITKNATNKIIEIGTAQPKPEVQEVQAVAANNTNGTINNIDYTKALNVVATGYTPYDPGCNGVTASGTPARRGVIAVDPKIIPMGTKVYIPGYGTAIAEDVGGAIKGNKIDLCYSTKQEAYSWGVRNVTVYILDK